MKKTTALLLIVLMIFSLVPSVWGAVPATDPMEQYTTSVRYFWENRDIQFFPSTPLEDVAPTAKELMGYTLIIGDGTDPGYPSATLTFSGFRNETATSAFSTGFTSYPYHQTFVYPGATVTLTIDGSADAYYLRIRNTSPSSLITVPSGQTHAFDNERLHYVELCTKQGVIVAYVMTSLSPAPPEGDSFPPQTATPSALTSFVDVPSGAWYEKEVAAAEKDGIIAGKGRNRFDPDGALSIAEAVTLAAKTRALYEGDSIPAGTGNSVWYSAYLDYAVQKGIVKAGDFKFYEKLITREEMAYIFNRTMPEKEYQAVYNANLPEAPDTDGSPYAADINRLYRCHIVSGTDSGRFFRPDLTINRAETAAIINRISKLTSFRDSTGR